MKITVSQLRRIIKEAVTDHMRLPRGENSRDDAEDRDVNDPADVGRINIEEAFMDRYKDPTPRGRSVGPDIDSTPSRGGNLKPEQVLVMFPEAARKWIKLMRTLQGDLTKMSPRDLIDSMQFRVDEKDKPPTLYADPKDENNKSECLRSIWRWDEEYGWESLS
jgi:hypothetical protein